MTTLSETSKALAGGTAMPISYQVVCLYKEQSFASMGNLKMRKEPTTSHSVFCAARLTHTEARDIAYHLSPLRHKFG